MAGDRGTGDQRRLTVEKGAGRAGNGLLGGVARGRQIKNGEPGINWVLYSKKLSKKQLSEIHETLYQSEDFANIELSDYVTRLANNLFLSAWAGREPIALEKNLEPVFLPLDRAVPCGLVMNELLTSSRGPLISPCRTASL